MVSATNKLKMTAADGKRYLTDVLDYNGVISLANLLNISIMNFRRVSHEEILKMVYLQNTVSILTACATFGPNLHKRY